MLKHFSKKKESLSKRRLRRRRMGRVSRGSMQRRSRRRCWGPTGGGWRVTTGLCLRWGVQRRFLKSVCESLVFQAILEQCLEEECKLCGIMLKQLGGISSHQLSSIPTISSSIPTMSFTIPSSALSNFLTCPHVLLHPIVDPICSPVACQQHYDGAKHGKKVNVRLDEMWKGKKGELLVKGRWGWEVEQWTRTV